MFVLQTSLDYLGLFFKNYATLLDDLVYHRQHPICQRPSFSYIDEIFAYFSLAGERGEGGSLYMLGCFPV